MNENPGADVPQQAEPGMRRRDWFLFFVILLLSPCLLGAGLELAARHFYYRLPYSGENCLVVHDPLRGALGIPGCTIEEKIPDGVVTQYRFNKNGYRDNVDFGPKQEGTYRIVMVGTSVAGGFRVPFEETISALLPRELSALTGRNVEVLSEGLPWRTAEAVSLNFNDALATKPDLILWIISPLDITYAGLMPKSAGADGAASAPDTVAGKWQEVDAIFSQHSFPSALGMLFSHTSSAVMLRALFYDSPSQYVQAAVVSGGEEKEFLRSQPGGEWQRQFAKFSQSVATIATQAREAGVPLAAVLVPDRTQAAMISLMAEKPDGFDPYRLGSRLRDTVMRSGEAYVNILPDYRTIRDPQLGYYPLDGHPNAQGHAIITRFLAAKLAPMIGRQTKHLDSTADMTRNPAR